MISVQFQRFNSDSIIPDWYFIKCQLNLFRDCWTQKQYSKNVFACNICLGKRFWITAFVWPVPSMETNTFLYRPLPTFKSGWTANNKNQKKIIPMKILHDLNDDIKNAIKCALNGAYSLLKSNTYTRQQKRELVSAVKSCVGFVMMCILDKAHAFDTCRCWWNWSNKSERARKEKREREPSERFKRFSYMNP